MSHEFQKYEQSVCPQNEPWSNKLKIKWVVIDHWYLYCKQRRYGLLRHFVKWHHEFAVTLHCDVMLRLFTIHTDQINASLWVVPVYRKAIGNRGGLREEPCGAWHSFGNNIEEYATTNETDFMGSVTMSPASGRQLAIHRSIFSKTLW